jgi:hypothetical protein
MPSAAVVMTGSNLEMLMPSLIDSCLFLPNARCDKVLCQGVYGVSLVRHV